MILNTRDNNKKVYVSEGQCRLIREYYGLPNNIDKLVDYIIGEIKRRWSDGRNDSFVVPCDGLPYGLLDVHATNSNVRACYAMPSKTQNLPCALLIWPGVLSGEDGEDGGHDTLHSTMVHELTHMIEDVGRRRSNEEGLGAELERIGYPKSFNNVINNRMFSKANKGNYSSIERAVNKVIYYGVGFERNARNAAMFTKLRDLPAGSIRTYKDAIEFLRSTKEYIRYESTLASAWYLVNLTDENDKVEALRVVGECSDYKFRNWNHFRKWLKQFINRYENKMDTIIPKMINHVINPPVE